MFFSVFGKLLINIQCSILAKYYGSGFVGLQSSDAIRRHRKVNLKSLFIYIFIEHLEHYEHYLKNNDLQTPLNRTFTEQ